MYRIRNIMSFVLLIVILTACSGATPDSSVPTVVPAQSDSPTIEPVQESGTAGGTLTIAVTSDPNVWVGVTNPNSRVVNSNLYDGLVKYDANDLSPKPNLAESWTSEDGKEWIFNLRHDVKWHDGEPFTASDVKFTFDMMLNKEVNLTNRLGIGNLETVEIIDDYTVKLVMAEPNAALPSLLGFLVFMVPEHILSGTDLNQPADFVMNPIGTGPFKFVEQVPGSYVKLVANDDYWDGRPKIDTLLVKVVPDANAAVALAKTGEADIIFPPADAIDSLSGESSLNVVFQNQVTVWFMGLNHADPLFNDLTVRKALYYSLDRQLIIDSILRGQATPATGPIVPLLKNIYTDQVQTYSYDIEQAKTLFAEAGWKLNANNVLEKDGIPFSFTAGIVKGHPISEPVAVAIQQNLKDIGVDMQIRAIDGASFDDEFFGGKLQAGIHFNNMPPTPELSYLYGTGGVDNAFGYSNPEIDAILSKGRSEVNPDNQIAVYQEFQKAVSEDLPVLWLWYPRETQAINNRVQNLPDLDLRNMVYYLNQVEVK